MCVCVHFFHQYFIIFNVQRTEVLCILPFLHLAWDTFFVLVALWLQNGCCSLYILIPVPKHKLSKAFSSQSFDLLFSSHCLSKLSISLGRAGWHSHKAAKGTGSSMTAYTNQNSSLGDGHIVSIIIVSVHVARKKPCGAGNQYLPD